MPQQRSNSRNGWSTRDGGSVGMSWFPGMTSSGRAERPQVACRGLVLGRTPTVGEVAARDDDIGRNPLDELADSPLERRVVEAVPRAEMEVGHVEDAR